MAHELADFEKSGHNVSVDDVPAIYDAQGIEDAKRGTVDDQANMYRMGKKPELKVRLDCYSVPDSFADCLHRGTSASSPSLAL